jgi:hypothetical protein
LLLASGSLLLARCGIERRGHLARCQRCEEDEQEPPDHDGSDIAPAQRTFVFSAPLLAERTCRIRGMQRQIRDHVIRPSRTRAQLLQDRRTTDQSQSCPPAPLVCPRVEWAITHVSPIQVQLGLSPISILEPGCCLAKSLFFSVNHAPDRYRSEVNLSGSLPIRAIAADCRTFATQVESDPSSLPQNRPRAVPSLEASSARRCRWV